MQLTLHLATSPAVQMIPAVKLVGSGLKDFGSAFPKSGEVAIHYIDASENTIDSLQIHFLVEGKELPIYVSKLPANSSISLLALPDRTFLGSAFHSEKANCFVTCDDGTAGENCVFCVKNGIKARVCC